MKYILGISAFYHDSSICLFRDNELIFAIEEEKFSGVKHDSRFPFKSLDYIFKKFKLTKDKIEAVCFYENPDLKLKRVLQNNKNQWFKNPFYCLSSYFNAKDNISFLNKTLPKYSDKVFYSNHHESHIYYSYFTSDFDDSVCLSIDGVGEIDTITMAVVKDKNFYFTSITEYPHSLGLFYAAMTSFLGFKPNEGEYKVMGLASYGNPHMFYSKVKELVKFKNSKLECNLDVFTWNRSNKSMFNHKLSELLEIDPRLPDEEILTVHKDLASAVQNVYEEMLINLLNTIGLFTDSADLCLSGGCAYNGVANGKIINNTDFKNLWIPVAPSDAGSAIGACLNYMYNVKKYNKKITKNPFLGPSFDDSYIGSLLTNKKKIKFKDKSLLLEYISKKLKEGKVVGWFQGHCEFGSRALGNRSILANPSIDGMKDRINKLIKKREMFRPFAPSVIKEKQHDFFIMNSDIPYMNQVVQVKPEHVENLKSVVHVDNSARVQTVYKNTIFHDLLKEFEKQTGYPILLNTSFNIKDKTMVLTPKDALETFYQTDIDILVLNNYIIIK